MNLLLDANLSPRLLDPLRAAGYTVEHVVEVGALLLADIPSVADDLEGGAVVSLSPDRLSVRDLPIR